MAGQFQEPKEKRTAPAKAQTNYATSLYVALVQLILTLFKSAPLKKEYF